jgi:hypothetical protein
MQYSTGRATVGAGRAKVEQARGEIAANSLSLQAKVGRSS